MALDDVERDKEYQRRRRERDKEGHVMLRERRKKVGGERDREKKVGSKREIERCGDEERERIEMRERGRRKGLSMGGVRKIVKGLVMGKLPQHGLFNAQWSRTPRTDLQGHRSKDFGFVCLDFNGVSASLPRMAIVPHRRNSRVAKTLVPKCSVSASRPTSQPRFIQHKKEAFLVLQLNDRRLLVVDVGGGTGFTTLGIIKHVDPKNVTILDQSPHQLEKAMQKKELKECKIIEGDAEDLPFPTDYADRYVSAGRLHSSSIREAYRVLKLGGKACLIGPVYPTHRIVLSSLLDAWMLFPKEEEYSIEWFTKAGFKDVQLKRIGPRNGTEGYVDMA
ncbi:hypothetical protein Syun_031362 [Stephania yunnanensis]|uniref:MPBQ/MBSQ family SAM-binding methyltransferase profile domain-containing protein n=1 Tax=Stephania yunnanensis TaxID=152371 RepID=A0AAP0E4A6_9MAGN